MNYQLPQQQQQYPPYNNQSGYPQGYSQNANVNPAWQQQARPPPNFPQQQQQHGMNGMSLPPPGQAMNQQQQQHFMAMMAARPLGGSSGQQQAGQGQGMMPPPQTIPGMGGVQSMTREQQQAAYNMMQAQQAAILQQQQQQAAAGGSSHGGAGGERGGAGPSHKKKKKLPPPPAQQMLHRQQPPPRSNEAYRQAAMANMVEIEPWADGLDEVDPREMAMGRFRSRQEVMSEIFSGEPIKDILAAHYDPWSGLSIDSESLADKVMKLERENDELSQRMDGDIGAFRQRLADAEGVEVSSVMVPA